MTRERTTSARRSRRRARTAAFGLLFLLVVLVGAAPSGAVAPSATAPVVDEPRAVVVNDLSVTALSSCGHVQLSYALLLTNTTLSRLPVSVYVSEPSRGLARTLLRTFSSPSDLNVTITSPRLYTADPSGVGPALTIEMVWNGGSTQFLTNQYFNNCPGTFFGLQPTRMVDTRVGMAPPPARSRRDPPRRSIPPPSPASRRPT